MKNLFLETISPHTLFQVIRIEEDLDYGCEDRSQNDPVKAVVILSDLQTSQQFRIKISDCLLYDHEIQEGDIVTVSQSNKEPVLLKNLYMQKTHEEL